MIFRFQMQQSKFLTMVATMAEKCPGIDICSYDFYSDREILSSGVYSCLVHLLDCNTWASISGNMVGKCDAQAQYQCPHY